MLSLLGIHVIGKLLFLTGRSAIDHYLGAKALHLK